MSIGKGDNVIFDNDHLGEVEQIITPPGWDLEAAIICYEDANGKKKTTRKPVGELQKPLDRQDENPCP